jgi:hypothetical protein
MKGMGKIENIITDSYGCAADGSYEVYDKKHLFSLSQEPKIYSPGHRRLIVDPQRMAHLPFDWL